MWLKIILLSAGVALIVVSVLVAVGFGCFAGGRYEYKGVIVLPSNEAMEFVAEHGSGIKDVTVLEDSNYMIVYSFRSGEVLPLSGGVRWDAVLLGSIIVGMLGVVLVGVVAFAGDW
jgi:hypothetical protein